MGSRTTEANMNNTKRCLNMASGLTVLGLAALSLSPETGFAQRDGTSFRERLSERAASRRPQQAEQATQSNAGQALNGANSNAAAGATQVTSAGVLEPTRIHIRSLTDGNVRGIAIWDATIAACAGTRDGALRETVITLNRKRAEPYPSLFEDFMQQYDERYNETLAMRETQGCAANAADGAYTGYRQRIDFIHAQSERFRQQDAAAPALPFSEAQTGNVATLSDGTRLDCMHTANSLQMHACIAAGVARPRRSPFANVLRAAVNYETWAAACNDPSGPAVRQRADELIAPLPAANREALAAEAMSTAPMIAATIAPAVAAQSNACLMQLPAQLSSFETSVNLALRTP
jgi:hypothetical protein